jgi:phospholipase C
MSSVRFTRLLRSAGAAVVIGGLVASSAALVPVGCGGSADKGGPGGGDAGGAGDAGDAGDPAAERQSCTFKPGARVATTLGDSNLTDAQHKIRHVIVMMKENRSFDHLFGGLADAGKSDVELPPANWSNPDATGTMVPIFAAHNTCFGLDPEHQSAQMVIDWDNGAMDGFVKNAQASSTDPISGTTGVPTDGHFVMAEHSEADLPFYYFLAKTYALADHYHSAALAGTWANRLYTICASSYGVKDTGVDFPPKLAGKRIFDALDTAKVSWGVYSDSPSPFEYTFFLQALDPANIHPTAQFFTDLSSGSLPSVVFVEGDSTSDSGKAQTSSDEHPPADLQVGEAWSKTIYDAVTTSPLWYDPATGDSAALLWTYDENGSFADHVPPPPACPPAGVSTNDMVYFTHYGPRVPFVVVSPYARPGYVSHVTHSHTSMTRLIEAIWDLGALTERDANSDALLDMFDFSAAALATPPAAPAAGKGGCNADGGP